MFGAVRPGYSHISQTISELAEVGAPNSVPMAIVGFLVVGALIAEFGYGMMRAFGSEGKLARAAIPIVLVGLGWVGAGVFPCGPCRGPDYNTQTSVHFLFATIVEISLIVAPFAIRGRVRGDPRWPEWFPRFLLAAGVAELVLWLLLSASFGVSALGEVTGVLQRMFLAVYFAWLLILAWPFARGSERGVPPGGEPKAPEAGSL